MKKIWKSLRGKSKIEITEFLIAILAILASLIFLLIDFCGIIPLSIEQLVSISIILLDILVASSIIERYGILNSIEEKCVAAAMDIPVLTTRRFFDHTHRAEDLWENATEVCLLAIANTSFLRGNGLTRLREAAKKGITVNLLSINPESALAHEYEESHILSPISIPLSDNVKAYRTIANSSKEFREKITMKVCNTIIPYSMIIIKEGNLVKHMKIDLYSINADNVDYLDRRSIVIPSSDIENTNFFLNQWNLFWDNPGNITI